MRKIDFEKLYYGIGQKLSKVCIMLSWIYMEV